MSGLIHISKSGDRKRVYAADADWHEIGDPGEPSFTSGWGNHGGSYGTAAFRVDSEGWVHLKGVVTRTSGTSWIPFALPEEYYPAEYWYRVSAREPTSVGARFGCQIEISNVNGNVTVSTFSNLYPERVILDGVMFPLFEQEYNYKTGVDGNVGTMVGTGTASLLPGTYFDGSSIWNSIWPHESGINTFFLKSTVAATTTYTWTWDGFECPFTQMLPYYVRNDSEYCRYLEIANRRGFYTSTTSSVTSPLIGEYFGEKAHENMIEPSLSNSWVEYGKDTYNTWLGVGYLKDKHGFVHLKGLVKSGSSASAVMFTLPTGYRPAYDVYHVGMSYSTIAATTYATIIKVGSNGEVSAYYGGSTTYTSISGVSFYAG